MRTKNPFCTGTQLAVLRALNIYRASMTLAAMAQKIRMSPATFNHALGSLRRAHHIEKDKYGYYVLTKTGALLHRCAFELERARK